MSRNGMGNTCRSAVGHLRSLAAAGTGACLLTTGIAIWAPGVAQGRASLSFTVNTTADAHDADPGDGKCADAAGQCTLRAALAEADAAPPGSTVNITVPAGGYDLTLGSLTLGSATVPLSITMSGAVAGSTVVASTGRFRVMLVSGYRTTGMLDNLQLSGGRAGPNSYGGGIFSQGRLTLSNDTLTGNMAGAGGGVANAGGTLTVTGSTIENNSGGGFGGGGIQNGGPRNLPGTVVVRSSTISGNVTGNEGGGIFSGQNGRPVTHGQAAVAPRRLCAPPRCAAPRLAAAAGLVLRVINSTVSGNRGGNGGGGIAAEGTATLTGSRVTGNTAGGAIGGGLFNVGTVSDSTISDNTASSGGGVEDYPGLVMTITNSTLDGNHGAADGGALDINQQINVIRSTIAGNRAGDSFFEGFGAAAVIDGGGTLVVSDSTIAGNTTRPPGRGAIDNFGGSLTLLFATVSGSQGLITGSGFNTATGTILAGNGTTPNCPGALSETVGYNLSTDPSCGLSKKTDLTNANPMLGPLADNGGPTMTQGLARSSPAVNAGGLPASSSCPAADQRGESRPWGSACDIGAYELHYKL
jgi:CSLREA domain-containing protein